jgi:hypothetical protein
MDINEFIHSRLWPDRKWHTIQTPESGFGKNHKMGFCSCGFGPVTNQTLRAHVAIEAPDLSDDSWLPKLVRRLDELGMLDVFTRHTGSIFLVAKNATKDKCMCDYCDEWVAWLFSDAKRFRDLLGQFLGWEG